MGSYVDSVVGQGEQVLYRARISLLSYFLFFVLGGMLGVTGILVVAIDHEGYWLLYVAAALIGGPLLSYWTTELAMTNRRLIAKVGFISRQTIELNLAKIESIRVKQGVFGRIFDFGDIIVVGTGGSQEPFSRISKPIEFRRKWDEVLVLAHKTG